MFPYPLALHQNQVPFFVFFFRLFWPRCFPAFGKAVFSGKGCDRACKTILGPGGRHDLQERPLSQPELAMMRDGVTRLLS